MAGQVKLLTTTFVADAAVSRYQSVILNTSNGNATPTATDNTGVFLGIADEDQDQGKTVNVVMKGLQWATAGAAISRGDNVVAGAGGTVKTAVGVTGPVVIGVALEAATAAGDIILVKLA